LLLLLGLLHSAKAQQPDSLWRKLRQHSNDTAAVSALADLSKLYWFSKPDSALLMAKQGVALARRLSFPEGLARCLNSVGAAHYVKGEYPQALANYRQALGVARSIGLQQVVGHSLNNIGVIHELQNNHPLALQYYTEALVVREQVNVKSDVAATLNNIGILHLKGQRYDDALGFFEKAMRIDREIDNQEGVGYDLSNIGLVYLRTNRHKEALPYFRASLAIKENTGNLQGIASTSLQIATCELVLGRPKAAAPHALTALAAANSINDRNLMAEAHDLLADVYTQRGDFYNALQHLKAGTSIRDSVFNAEKTRIIADTEARYQLERKQHDLELLDANYQKNRVRNYAIVGVLVLVLLLVLVTGLYLIQRLRLKQLQKQRIIDEIAFINSHHLRAPLSNILGLVNLFDHENPASEANAEIVTLLGRAANDLDKVVRDVSNKAQV
jgi:tetratricopeptide (TPR) repeat protein